MIELHDLSKSFGGLQVIRDATLTVRPGEILGLIGPNGAGKTTLFNLLSGLLRPDSGVIRFEGRDITRLKPEERVRQLRLGRTFQVVRPFLDLTGEENIRVALETRGLSSAGARERARELLREVHLEAKAGRLARELPLMDKKKLELARALALEPRLLLLDEVMSGLNPTEVQEALALVQRLNREHGVTIFWIEHLIRAVSQAAHRLVVLHQGAILREGGVDEVLRDPSVIDAYLGEGHE